MVTVLSQNVKKTSSFTGRENASHAQNTKLLLARRPVKHQLAPLTRWLPRQESARNVALIKE
jgi:hypothetical protein